MERLDLDRRLAWFLAFADRHLNGREQDRANIILKKDHTLRVVDLARLILADLAPAPEPGLADHILLAALLHDIGRFPQYVKYRTYLDKASENHGRLGVRTLLAEGVLEDLGRAGRKLLLGTVFGHNLARLPERLPPHLALALQVVRDADKLDIYEVMLTRFYSPISPDDPFRLGRVKDQAAYTPTLLDRLRARQGARYDEIVYENDHKLFLCGWVYELNFSRSLKILRQRGYLKGLLACLPAIPEIVDLGRQLQADLDRLAGQG